MTAGKLRVVFLDAASLPRVLVFDPDLKVDYQAYDATQPDDVADRIENANVVITNKVRLGQTELRRARALKLICIAAAGTDNVDLAAAGASGITVENVPDYGSQSVAEHVIATLFALRRQLVVYASAAIDGRWSASSHFCWTGPPIRDLDGTVFGIVGRGRIGEAAAKLARGLGMKVIFAKTSQSECRDDEVALEELLATSDALTLHVPLTPATRGLINASSLAAMKPDAVLINTGRGALVDADALADALRDRVIAGAAIDVLDDEPPKRNHPLLSPRIPNLLLTPHVAWASETAQARLANRLIDLVRMHRGFTN